MELLMMLPVGIYFLSSGQPLQVLLLAAVKAPACTAMVARHHLLPRLLPLTLAGVALARVH